MQSEWHMDAKLQRLSKKRKLSRATLPNRVFIGGIPVDTCAADVQARFGRAGKVTPVVCPATGAFRGRVYVDIAPQPPTPSSDPVGSFVKAYHGTLWRGSRLRVEPAEADFAARLESEKAVFAEEAEVAQRAALESAAQRRAALAAVVAKRMAVDGEAERAASAAAAAAREGSGAAGAALAAQAPILPLRIRKRKGERFLRVRGDPLEASVESEAAAAARLAALPEAKRAKQRSNALRLRAQHINLGASGDQTGGSRSTNSMVSWAQLHPLDPIPTPSTGMAAAQTRAVVLQEVEAAHRREEGGEGGVSDGSSCSEDGDEEEKKEVKKEKMEEEEEEEEGEEEEEEGEEEEEEEEEKEREGPLKRAWSKEEFDAAASSIAVCGALQGVRVVGGNSTLPLHDDKLPLANSSSSSPLPLPRKRGAKRLKPATGTGVEGPAAPVVVLAAPWREMLYGSTVAAAGRSQLPATAAETAAAGAAGGRLSSLNQPGVTHFMPLVATKGGRIEGGAAATAPVLRVKPLDAFQGVVAPFRDTSFTLSQVCSVTLEQGSADAGDGKGEGAVLPMAQALPAPSAKVPSEKQQHDHRQQNQQQQKAAAAPQKPQPLPAPSPVDLNNATAAFFAKSKGLLWRPQQSNK